MNGRRWAAGWLVLAGGLLCVGFSLWLGVPFLHHHVERQLSHALGRAVWIQRISFDLPSKITAHEVVVSATPEMRGDLLFTAQQVTLTIRGHQLLSAFIHRRWDSLCSEIALSRPSIRLEAMGPVILRESHPSLGASSWPSGLERISCQDGEVVIPLSNERQGRIVVAHLQGSLERHEPFHLALWPSKRHDRAAPRVRGQLQGVILHEHAGRRSVPLIERMSFKGFITEHAWEGNLAVAGVSMEHLGPLWEQIGPEGARRWGEGRWTGRLYGTLSIGGPWPWRGRDWTQLVNAGTLTAQGIRWQRRAGQPPLGLDGTLHLLTTASLPGAQLRTESLTITTGQNRVAVRGVLGGLWTHPWLKLSAAGEAIDLAALPQCIPDPLWNQLPITGVAGVKVAVEGPLAHPHLEGDVTVSEGRIGVVPFGQGRFRIRYQLGLLSLEEAKLPLGDGMVSVQGTVSPEALHLDGHVVRLSLFQGSLSSSWTVRGTLQAPVMTGSLSLTEARYGHHHGDRVSGTFRYAGQRLMIRAVSSGAGNRGTVSLDLNGLSSPGQFVIEHVSLRFHPWRERGDDGWQIEGRGSVTTQELAISRLELRQGQGLLQLQAGMAFQRPGHPFWIRGVVKQLPIGSLVMESRLAASGQLRRSPWEVTGQVALPGLRLNGHSPGDFSGHLSMNAHRAELSMIHWGRLTATSQWPPTGGTIVLTGQRDLQQRWVALNLNISNVSVGPIAQSLGITQPMSGAGEGTLSVQGPLWHPALTGVLKGRDLRYGGRLLGEWRVAFHLTSGPPPSRPLLTFQAFSVKGPGHEWYLQEGSTIEFTSPSQGTAHLVGELRNIRAGPITLFGGMTLQGAWTLSPPHLEFTGQLVTHHFWLNDHGVEGITLNLRYHDHRLDFLEHPGGRRATGGRRAKGEHPIQVLGTVNLEQWPQVTFQRLRLLQAQPGEPLFTVDGDVGPDQWQFQTEGRGLDVKTFAELLEIETPTAGIADFTITSAGSPSHPELTGLLTIQQGCWGKLSFATAKARFTWKDDRFFLLNFKVLDRPRYTILGSGSFPLAATPTGWQRLASHPIDLTFELADSHLAFLQSLSHSVKRATGKTQGRLNISGTLADPQFHGRFQIQGGALTATQYVRRAQDIVLDLEWDGREARIHDARAKIGGGRLQGEGCLVFQGFKIAQYDLHLRTLPPDGVALSLPFLPIPESPLFKRVGVLSRSSYGEPRLDLDLTGPGNNPTLEGRLELAKTHFNFPPPPSQSRPPQFDEWLRRVHWNVRMVAPETTWYENELVNVNLRGDLLFQGQGNDLKIYGGWEAMRGRISYLGVEFTVQRAVFSVLPSLRDGRIVNVPYLEGTAESTARVFDPVTREPIEDVITLTIDRAPISEIKPRFTSRNNPRLPPEKVLAQLTQLDVERLSPQERQTIFQQQVVRLLDSTLATPFARNLLRRTGVVDEVRVSYSLDPTRDAPLLPAGDRTANLYNLLLGTKYTFEKNLSRRIALGYSVRVNELQSRLDLRHEVELSYRWTHNVFVKGTYGLARKDAADPPDRRLTIEPHWRFGWED